MDGAGKKRPESRPWLILGGTTAALGDIGLFEGEDGLQRGAPVSRTNLHLPGQLSYALAYSADTDAENRIFSIVLANGWEGHTPALIFHL